MIAFGPSGFIKPRKYQMDNIPKPENDQVQLRVLEKQKVAVICFQVQVAEKI